MAMKETRYYLTKANRLSGWLLFLLVSLYLVTGFSLCGMFGFGQLLGSREALVIHKLFDWPLIICFLIHSAISIYDSFRRWGWIGKREPS